jgi:hypothetical protein
MDRKVLLLFHLNTRVNCSGTHWVKVTHFYEAVLGKEVCCTMEDEMEKDNIKTTLMVILKVVVVI